MRSRFFEILLGLNVLALGTSVFADTKVAYYDDGRDIHWIIGHTEPEYLSTKFDEAYSTEGFEYADPAKFDTQLDCDRNRVIQLATIAEIANAIEGGYAGSLPQKIVDEDERSDEKKISGDIVSVRKGQGTILSENNCLAIINTAFHVIQDNRKEFGGKRSTVVRDLDNWNSFSPIKKIGSKEIFGDVIKVVTIDGMGSTLEKSEESALLVVKKKGCNPSNPGTTRNHEIFDILNVKEIKEKFMDHLDKLEKENKIRLAEGKEPKENLAGIYRVCRYDGEVKKQKAGIARMHFTNNRDGSHKQDLAKMNAFSQSGNSGCPVVYRDPGGVDHFLGTLLLGAGTDLSGNIGDDDKVTDNFMFSVFNGQIRDKLKKLRDEYL